jgi:hypothetical protein
MNDNIVPPNGCRCGVDAGPDRCKDCMKFINDPAGVIDEIIKKYPENHCQVEKILKQRERICKTISKG